MAITDVAESTITEKRLNYSCLFGGWSCDQHMKLVFWTVKYVLVTSQLFVRKTSLV